MRIFVAGGSGTIGVPLVRALIAAGHQVTALTRSPDKQQMLGATAAVADALDATALKTAVLGVAADAWTGARLPCIHLDDAVAATIAALVEGAPGSSYDIVDDRPVSMTEIVQAIAEYTGAPAPLAVPGWLPRLVAPYLAEVTSLRLPLSNAKARAELKWQPRYSTWRDGLSRMLERAA